MLGCIDEKQTQSSPVNGSQLDEMRLLVQSKFGDSFGFHDGRAEKVALVQAIAVLLAAKADVRPAGLRSSTLAARSAASRGEAVASRGAGGCPLLQ